MHAPEATLVIPVQPKVQLIQLAESWILLDTLMKVIHLAMKQPRQIVRVCDKPIELYSSSPEQTFATSLLRVLIHKHELVARPDETEHFISIKELYSVPCEFIADCNSIITKPKDHFLHWCIDETTHDSRLRPMIGLQKTISSSTRA